MVFDMYRRSLWICWWHMKKKWSMELCFLWIFFFLRVDDGMGGLSVAGVLCFFFFFSSRRRHTRCSRDWSSDVCSSDLIFLGAGEHRYHEALGNIAAAAPDRVAVEFMFTDRVEHRLLAGADALLMPSL